MPNIKDYTGQRFGKLTAVKRNGAEKRGAALWLFQCDCGNTKTLRATAVLKDKSIAHCGCVPRKVHKTHGMTGSFEFRVWTAMRKRCSYEKHVRFKHYGGRGISICDRWASSFENFFSDMGKAPDSSYSIERIDVNGNYEPNNCKWIPKLEQSKNRRKRNAAQS